MFTSDVLSIGMSNFMSIFVLFFSVVQFVTWNKSTIFWFRMPISSWSEEKIPWRLTPSTLTQPSTCSAQLVAFKAFLFRDMIPTAMVIFLFFFFLNFLGSWNFPILNFYYSKWAKTEIWMFFEQHYFDIEQCTII